MLGRLIISVTALMTCLVAVSTAMAQASSLSATMNVHVFPSQGQDEIQQAMDEADCYGWAADRTGTDPFELSRQAQEQMAASGPGHGTGAICRPGLNRKSGSRRRRNRRIDRWCIRQQFTQRLERCGCRRGHWRGNRQFPQARRAGTGDRAGRSGVGSGPGRHPGANG